MHNFYIRGGGFDIGHTSDLRTDPRRRECPKCGALLYPEQLCCIEEQPKKLKKEKKS